MWLEFKIMLNTEDGKGEMDLAIEKGADPNQVNMEKVKQQLIDLYDRMMPVAIDSVPPVGKAN